MTAEPKTPENVTLEQIDAALTEAERHAAELLETIERIAAELAAANL